MTEIKQQIHQWLDKLRAGTLTETDFLQALDRLNGDTAKRQHLLYLQARTTSLASEVLGMALVENGQIVDGPDNPDDWPYKTILDALNAGWRIIKFPEMALLLQEDQTIGLGCEFILEKIAR
tara:strand:- start:18 stop:383 length:366 start_codon:yes stop_codon:yes gene_type:complete